MSELKLGDTRIPYTVRRGKSSKYLHLHMKRHSLEVVLPTRSYADIDAVFRRKQAWILRKYEEMRKSKPVFDGNRILFHGAYLNLQVVDLNSTTYKTAAIEDGTLIVPTKGDTNVWEHVKEWMTSQTRRYLNGKIPVLARQMRLKHNGVQVKGISKWGYCARNGSLVFSWQLSALPKPLSEYVVLHELTHLSEFNHSKSFRSKLASICPDYKERQASLRLIHTTPLDLFLQKSERQ